MCVFASGFVNEQGRLLLMTVYMLACSACLAVMGSVGGGCLACSADLAVMGSIGGCCLPLPVLPGNKPSSGSASAVLLLGCVAGHGGMTRASANMLDDMDPHLVICRCWAT